MKTLLRYLLLFALVSAGAFAVTPKEPTVADILWDIQKAEGKEGWAPSGQTMTYNIASTGTPQWQFVWDKSAPDYAYNPATGLYDTVILNAGNWVLQPIVYHSIAYTSGTVTDLAPQIRCTITNHGGFLITATAPSGETTPSYAWYENGTLVAGATGVSFHPTTSTSTVQVVITCPHGNNPVGLTCRTPDLYIGGGPGHWQMTFTLTHCSPGSVYHYSLNGGTSWVNSTNPGTISLGSSAQFRCYVTNAPNWLQSGTISFTTPQ